MRLICQRCERMFDGNDRAKLPARYCPECAHARKNEQKRAAYHGENGYQPREVGYVLVKDPSEYPLTPGMTISIEEHDKMCSEPIQSYTPGTIIRRNGHEYVIKMHKGKMKAVRI